MTILKCFSSAGTFGRNCVYFHLTRRLFQRTLFRQDCISVSAELNHVTAFTRCYVKHRPRKTRPNKWHAYSQMVFNECIEGSEIEGFKLDNKFIKLEENLESFTGSGKGNIRFQIINLIALSEHASSELILHYVYYLKSKSSKISPPMLLRAIECVTPHYPNKGLEWIYEYLEKIPLEIIPRDCLKSIIENLLYTKDWKYGIELIEKCYHSVFVSHPWNFAGLAGKVLLAALEYEDVETYNTFLEKHWSCLHDVGADFFVAVTNMIEVGRISPEICLEVLKSSLYNNRLFLDQAQELKKTFEKYWSDSVKIEFIQMSNTSCTCPACGEELQKPHFSEEELKQLEKGFIKMAVNDGGDFEVQQLRGLLNYLQNHGPFDVILDTLNTFRGFTYQKSSFYDLKEKQEMIALKLGIPLPKMLFIDPYSSGGKYTLPEGCYVFPFKGNRRGYKGFDDIAMIIATLNSGPDTYYLSADLFRDHLGSGSLSRDEYLTFIAWRQSRQIKNSSIKEVVEIPNPFVSVTQGTDGGWHVPFSIPFGMDMKSVRTHEFQNNFMCIQKLKHWKPSPMYSRISEDLKRFSKKQAKVELERS